VGKITTESGFGKLDIVLMGLYDSSKKYGPWKVQKISLSFSAENSKDYCCLRVEKQGNIQQKSKEHT